MLTSGSIVAFLSTTNGERSRDFYQRALGLRFVSDDEFALVFDAHGTMLRIQKVTDAVVAPYTALGWAVPDVAEVVRALRDRGVVFEKYSFLEQDALSIWTSPSGARVAWFKDPEGHVLSVTQR